MTRCATASPCGSPCEAGWKRARNTCLAADAVSLLAAIVLYIFAAGVVKGFAFALGLSTVIDLAIFFWFTHPMVSLLARFRFFNRGHKLSGLDAARRSASTALDAVEEARPDGQVLARLGNDLYKGQQVDRLRRPQVALVRHLRRRSCCWRSAASCVQGPQLWASSSPVARSTSVSALEPASPRRRRRAARGGRRHAASRPPPRPSSPPRATSADHRADRAAHRQPRAPRSSTRSSRPCRRRPAAVDLPGPRSAPAGARRSPSARSPAWCVFLVLVVLFIWAYFREWKMSVAAIVALAHDVIITVGVYALSGFEVTPGDRHRRADHPRLLALRHRRGLRQGPREHQGPREPTRTTYAEAANLAVNQTLVRSINTSIVALIPVGAILYVGAVQLGSGLAEGPRARAVRRHGRRCLLLDLHRHAAAGAAEAGRGRGQAGREAGPARERRTRPTAYAVGAGRSPRTCRCQDEPAGERRPGRGRRRRRPSAARRRRSRTPEAERPGPRRTARRRGRSASSACLRAAAADSGRPSPSGARSDRSSSSTRARCSAARRRRPRLPRAGRRLQGHHPAAGRPRRRSRR